MQPCRYSRWVLLKDNRLPILLDVCHLAGVLLERLQNAKLLSVSFFFCIFVSGANFILRVPYGALLSPVVMRQVFVLSIRFLLTRRLLGLVWTR